MIKILNFNATEQKRVASISNEFARASFILNPREFKIFLNTVSLIKPDSNTMEEKFFTYKEIETLVGTPESKRSISALRKLLASTITNLVYFDKDRANGYTLMTSYASKDASKIRLKINEDLKEHFLLVENTILKEENGSTKTIQNVKKFYTKIDMKYFNKLSSKYSMRLYILIKSYQTRYITEDFSLDDFKYFFALEKDISDVKVFNRNILKKSITEINDKTDIIVTINPIKQNGKTIVGYSFKIRAKANVQIEEHNNNKDDSYNSEAEESNNINENNNNNNIDKPSDSDAFCFSDGEFDWESVCENNANISNNGLSNEDLQHIENLYKIFSIKINISKEEIEEIFITNNKDPKLVNKILNNMN